MQVRREARRRFQQRLEGRARFDELVGGAEAGEVVQNHEAAPVAQGARRDQFGGGDRPLAQQQVSRDIVLASGPA